jgi:uncharacterized protein YqeY
MTLMDRLNDDLKTAMRAKDEVARGTLRMIMAELKNRKIEAQRDLTEDDVIAVLQRGVKTRKDSIEQYQSGGRQDLADKEQAELDLLTGYLPQVKSEDETRAIVAAKIEELGLTSKRDMGQIMKAVLAEHGATVDGKVVSRFAGQLLS